MPLHAFGALGLEDTTASVSWQPGRSNRPAVPVLASPRVFLTLYKHSWIAIGAPDAPPIHHVAAFVPETYLMENASLAVDKYKDEGLWSIQTWKWEGGPGHSPSEQGHTTVNLSLLGPASIRAALPAISTERGFIRNGYPFAGADAAGTPIVNVTARVSKINVTGTPVLHLQVFGADLTFTGWEQPDWGHQKPNAKPAWKSLLLRTGLHAVEELPGVWNVTATLALFELSSREPAHLDIDGPFDVSVQAANVTAVGRLEIPNSDGRLQWGAIHFNESVPALIPKGLFAIGSPEPGKLQIEGATFNSPPQAPVFGLGGEGTEAAALLLAGLVAVSGATAALWRRGQVLVVGLFTRLAHDKLLQHPRRGLIMEAVALNPGLTVEALARLLGLSRGVVEYHLEVLVRGGRLVRRRFGGQTAIFAGRDAASASNVIALRNPTARAVYVHLQESSSLTQAELVRRVGVNQSYVSKILRRLLTSGVIEEHHLKGRKTYAIRPRA